MAVDRDSDFSNSGSYPPSSGNFNSGNYPSGEYHKHLEEVDEQLSCAICLSRFTDPRLLSCHHTYCKLCLEGLLHNKEREHFDQCEIVCPRCRIVTQLGRGGVETLHKNYALERVVDVMPPEPTETRPFVRQISVPTCSRHAKELVFYCKTDNTLLCADCLVPEHRHHDFHGVNDVLATEKEKFHDRYFEMLEKERQKFKLAVDEVSYAINTLRQRGEQTKEKIQLHFQSLRESLVQREEELVTETQKIISLKVDRLQEQEKLLKELFNGLDTEYEICRRLMDTTAVEFLRDRDKYAEKVTMVVRKANHIDRTPAEVPTQGPYWHHPSTSLTDTAGRSGVFCDPVPSMYTATGVGLTKAFVGKESTFKVEARDKYGNKSFMKGTAPQISIAGPNREVLSYTIDQAVPGEFLVSYTPSFVGWHTISIKVNGEAIKHSESKLIVFGNKDYQKMSVPFESVSKSKLSFEPPVSTMRGVCILPNGWIIFVDSSCLRVIDGFSGRTCQTIGSYGTAPGQFNNPYDVALTPQNHIFVTDVMNHRVQRFAPEARNRYRYVSMFGTQGSGRQNFNSPEGIAALGDDRVFVADRGNNRILVISQKNMKYHTVIGKRGDRPGQFNQPRDVAVGPEFILVSDSGNKRVQALTYEGKPVAMFGGYNYIVFKPRIPSFIAIDSYGFIIITYKELNLITVLTPQGEGTPVKQFTSKYLKTPFGICTDKLGNIIVSDSASSRLLCF